MLQRLRDLVIARIAGNHITGPDIGSAFPVCRWADDRNISTILSRWVGDNGEGKDRQENFERFRSDLVTLQKENLTRFYSLKLNAIGYDVDLFRALLETARRHDIELHIDSLNPGSAPTCFRLLEQVAEFSDILGCTLPSRWKRSLEDGEQAADLGLSVRVVKGQWKDPDHRVDSRDHYLAIVDRLAGRSRHVGVATHDRPLAEKALKKLAATGTDRGMEQFFSLPLNGMELARRYECPYRLYVAYGAPAIPYNYRFSLNRPAHAAWMVSDFATGGSRPWMQNG